MRDNWCYYDMLAGHPVEDDDEPIENEEDELFDLELLEEEEEEDGEIETTLRERQV